MIPNVLDLGIEGLEREMKALGQPKYRAQQIWRWVVQDRVFDFTQMTNLPANLQELLQERYVALPVAVEKIYQSTKDNTQKIIGLLYDNNRLETVMMAYNYGTSVCVSSQVGCAMGCAFCASAHEGLVRNCTYGEMLGQVLLSQLNTPKRIDHVVVMGIGEPFANYANLVRFVKTCGDDDNGLGLSFRNITVSTCGLVPQIYRFAQEGLPVTLALSLHAPQDQLRKKLLPIAASYSVQETLEACWYYFKKTRRRVTIEYILIDGLNDDVLYAQELVDLLRGHNTHVNLIPLNDVKHQQWRPSSKAQCRRFASVLSKAGISVSIRRQMGDDIEAACGQLRRHHTHDDIP